jgi:hypothetical protein
MEYTEEQLKQISFAEPLSDKDLEIFSVMTDQEVEEYRLQKYPDYVDLKRIENLIGSGRLDGSKYMLEIAKLRKIKTSCPSPRDAQQQMVARVTQ